MKFVMIGESSNILDVLHSSFYSHKRPRPLDVLIQWIMYLHTMQMWHLTSMPSEILLVSFVCMIDSELSHQDKGIEASIQLWKKMRKKEKILRTFGMFLCERTKPYQELYDYNVHLM